MCHPSYISILIKKISSVIIIRLYRITRTIIYSHHIEAHHYVQTILYMTLEPFEIQHPYVFQTQFLYSSDIIMHISYHRTLHFLLDHYMYTYLQLSFYQGVHQISYTFYIDHHHNEQHYILFVI